MMTADIAKENVLDVENKKMKEMNIIGESITTYIDLNIERRSKDGYVFMDCNGYTFMRILKGKGISQPLQNNKTYFLFLKEYYEPRGFKVEHGEISWES